jgi:hypothetical protein
VEIAAHTSALRDDCDRPGANLLDRPIQTGEKAGGETDVGTDHATTVGPEQPRAHRGGGGDQLLLQLRPGLPALGEPGCKADDHSGPGGLPDDVGDGGGRHRGNDYVGAIG